jgi:Tol biopolymer transport system component
VNEFEERRKTMNKLQTTMILASILPLALSAAEYPEELLPPHITKLTEIGQRAEWSLDGTKVMYVTEAGGEVEEVDIETGEKKIISYFQRPDNVGFYRALYLSNGDYLLTGGTARREAYIYILDKGLEEPPTIIDENVWEGPAVSRRNLKLAWTDDHQDIFTADIQYINGKPELVNRERLFDNRVTTVEGNSNCGTVEPQNWRPPLEEEIIFACYDYQSTETFGYVLETGEFTNYSQTPDDYDEPEGIFPNGEYTLTECDIHDSRGMQYIDVYMLKLDGSGETTRLIHFNDTEGFKSSNPVVRDDARYIAFQEAATGAAACRGQGIYLFDLEEAGLRQDLSGLGCTDSTADNYDPDAILDDESCEYTVVHPAGTGEAKVSVSAIDGKLQIEVAGSRRYTLKIMDVNGNVLINVHSGKNVLDIPAHKFAQGLYLLSVERADKYVMKIIIGK